MDSIMKSICYYRGNCQQLLILVIHLYNSSSDWLKLCFMDVLEQAILNELNVLTWPCQAGAAEKHIFQARLLSRILAPSPTYIYHCKSQSCYEQYCNLNALPQHVSLSTCKTFCTHYSSQNQLKHVIAVPDLQKTTQRSTNTPSWPCKGMSRFCQTRASEYFWSMLSYATTVS